MGPPHRRHGSPHGRTNGLRAGDPSRGRDAVRPVGGELTG